MCFVELWMFRRYTVCLKIPVSLSLDYYALFIFHTMVFRQQLLAVVLWAFGALLVLFSWQIDRKNAKICGTSECMSKCNDGTIVHHDAQKTVEKFVLHVFESLCWEKSEGGNCILQRWQAKSEKRRLLCLSFQLQCVTTVTFVKTDQNCIVFR